LKTLLQFDLIGRTNSYKIIVFDLSGAPNLDLSGALDNYNYLIWVAHLFIVINDLSGAPL